MCSYISDDGNWDACPDTLECFNSHTLLENLFNPINYKQRECPDKVEGSHFVC